MITRPTPVVVTDLVTLAVATHLKYPGLYCMQFCNMVHNAAYLSFDDVGANAYDRHLQHVHCPKL